MGSQTLTASHSCSPLSFHLDNSFLPPVHLYNSVLWHGPLQGMSIGKWDEEERWTIGVFTIDISQCWEVAMIIVVVRDDLGS
jgi:hypothetical protein